MTNISLLGDGSISLICLLNMIRRSFLLCLGFLFFSSLCSAQLVQTIERIKPSIVGVGTYQKMRAPSVNFLGTGFVVNDGLHVVTNSHVIPKNLNIKNKETYVVITGEGKKPEFRTATVVTLDSEHDLALLKISGAALPAMKLGEAGTIREGRMMAYTGFPIGMVLGFYPVTHQAIVSSITPIILPAHNSRQLDASKIRQLKSSPFMIFQLDGIAYPGSSGSPLYDSETGLVYGIVNMVFVKGKKESALTNPSGISYAIPGSYIRNLLNRDSYKN